MSDLERAFRLRYGTEPVRYWAPGRVNLIGDHVDYCGGKVLPMPIQFGTEVAVASGRAGRIRAASLERDERLDFDAATPPALPPGHWGRFVVGAVAIAAQHGVAPGHDVLVTGNVPGSGLSSSASLSVALLYGLSDSSGRPLSGLPLARAAQRIEHAFVGVQCGLMDQAVIALGTRGSALLFDCADQAGAAVTIPPDAPAVLVFDTARTRALSGSSYNTRFDETRRAAAELGIPHDRLAHATPHAVAAIADPVLRRRARHVVAEQARVDAAVAAFAAHDWARLGGHFDASHASLRDDFEVSCAELDRAATLLRAEPACFGARMTGGGFGGSVVALVRREDVDAVRERVTMAYRREMGLDGRGFVAVSCGGVRRL